MDAHHHALEKLQTFLDHGEARMVLDHAWAAGGVREVTPGEVHWVLDGAACWTWGYHITSRYNVFDRRFYGEWADEDVERGRLDPRFWSCPMFGTERFDGQYEVPVATGKPRIPLMWWGNPVRAATFAVDEHITFVDWAGVPIDVPDYRRVVRVTNIDTFGLPGPRLRGAETSISRTEKSRTPEHLIKRKARLDGRR